jgi:hypothetical protein
MKELNEFATLWGVTLVEVKRDDPNRHGTGCWDERLVTVVE